MSQRIAVIGAGISGITIASLLQQENQVVVFEKHPYKGGLIHCGRTEGYLYHEVGGHVFNSKNQDVLKWFWSKFDRENEFVKAKRNAKILFNNKLIGYPIENFLYELNPDIVGNIVREMLQINQNRHDSVYADFGQFLKLNFGQTLYDLYFKPYNEKIWRTDLSTVSMDWLEGKLPMPDLKEMILANIIRKEEETMVHASFFYPKKGGSQFIADRLSEGLDIRYEKALDSIRIREGTCMVEGEWYDKVIYTGDVRRLPAIVKNDQGEPLPYPEGITSLRSNGTSNMLCTCDPNDLSWLYIPEPAYKAHRIIYTGNFSASNNPEGAARSSCTVEFSGECSPEEMHKELSRLPGNLVAIDHHYEANSYVIQDNQTRHQITAYKKILEDVNIHLLGRFAEWEYYNMDKAMEAAFEVKKQIQAT